MKANKALFSKLMIGVILLSALAAPTSIAFADDITVPNIDEDPPDGNGDVYGTDVPDSITISGDTVTGNVYGGDGNDDITIKTGATIGTVGENNTGDVYGDEGDDVITIETGTTVLSRVYGDGFDGLPFGSGTDVIVNNGSVSKDINGGAGKDDITNNGTVNGTICGSSGVDTIVNNGTANFIGGGPENDEIFNYGSVEQINGHHTGGNIWGGTGDDIITNSGTVENDILGKGDNDTITNSGTVGDDIMGHSGNDTITNSGTVEDNILGQGGDDTVILTGENVVVSGIICGGEAGELVGDTLEFRMSTYNVAQYDAAKTSIAEADSTVDMLWDFDWGEGIIQWKNFETLLDNMTLLFAAPPPPAPAPAPAAKPAPVYVPSWVLVSGEDTILEVYQNDLGNILRFFDLEDDSNTFIAELKESAWENAEAGEVLLDVLSEDLERQLVVTMQEDGTLLVEYFNTSGELLYSEIVIP